jgi:hypothetical protein
MDGRADLDAVEKKQSLPLTVIGSPLPGSSARGLIIVWSDTSWLTEGGIKEPFLEICAV